MDVPLANVDDGRVLADEVIRLQPDLVALRRRLHRTPELGLDLPETQAVLMDALAGLELELTTYHGFSGAAAVLRGAHPGPVVLLRADMDALPAPRQPMWTSRSTVRACTRVGTTCT